MYSHFKSAALTIALFTLLANCGGNVKKRHGNVEITSFLGDNQTFLAGDKMQFLINLEKPAYLHLFYENANGEVVQLAPSILQTSNEYDAGDFIVFPPESSEVQLEVSSPFGPERVWLAACDQLVSININRSTNQLSSYEGSLDSLVNVFLSSANTNSAACSFAELSFSTQP